MIQGPRSDAKGLVVVAPENTQARYVRIFSGPSPVAGTNGAHFMDVAVEGTVDVDTECE